MPHIAVNNFLVITGRCGIKFLSDDAFDAKVTSLLLLDVKLYDGIVYMQVVEKIIHFTFLQLRFEIQIHTYRCILIIFSSILVI